MSNSERKKGFGAAARVTALASSVMDLHVRIALQEMDREKRRLISGGIFLATGGVLMLFALLGSELILGFWIRELLGLDMKSTILILVVINLETYSLMPTLIQNRLHLLSFHLRTFYFFPLHPTPLGLLNALSLLTQPLFYLLRLLLS